MMVLFKLNRSFFNEIHIHQQGGYNEYWLEILSYTSIQWVAMNDDEYWPQNYQELSSMSRTLLACSFHNRM